MAGMGGAHAASGASTGSPPMSAHLVSPDRQVVAVMNAGAEPVAGRRMLSQRLSPSLGCIAIVMRVSTVTACALHYELNRRSGLVAFLWKLEV